MKKSEYGRRKGENPTQKNAGARIGLSSAFNVAGNKNEAGLPRIQSTRSRYTINQGDTKNGVVSTKGKQESRNDDRGRKPAATVSSLAVLPSKRNLQPMRKERKQIVPSSRAVIPRHQYTVKPIIPAKTAELLDVARAMHRDQFATRVKKLFDPEREAALQAIETGIYVGWRCVGNDFDCIRVGQESRCFCGHSLSEHQQFEKKRGQNLACLSSRCSCKSFAFIPSRPEEIGEWWLQKRQGFDVTSWRAKCRCKHSHEEHNPNGNRKCQARGCTCFSFDSNFLCAACDKHWEEHETGFDDLNSRQQKGLPYGEEYLPFHELPQLRNIVLTGEEDDDSQYNALTSGPYAIPRSRATDLALQLQGKKT